RCLELGRRSMRSVLFVVHCLAVTSSAWATVVSAFHFSGPPPAMLGPYKMTSFPPNPASQFDLVSAAPGPFGEDVLFSMPLYDLKVVNGGSPGAWGTWGYGYNGDIYSSFTSHTLVLTLPENTRAFHLVVGTSQSGLFTLTADTTIVKEG